MSATDASATDASASGHSADKRPIRLVRLLDWTTQPDTPTRDGLPVVLFLVAVVLVSAVLWGTIALDDER